MTGIIAPAESAQHPTGQPVTPRLNVETGFSRPSYSEDHAGKYSSNRITVIRLEHMNDTNRTILAFFQRGDILASSDIHERLQDNVSLVTVKRALTELYDLGYVEREGAGRSVRYRLSRRGILLKPLDTESYLDQPQEKRLMTKQFNHDVFSGDYIPVFDEAVLARLENATKDFRQKAANNQAVHSKELQRFMVEMSWKSGRIEGNTYTLLDTEKLLAYGIASTKNTQFETQMLLNQKAAFDVVWETKEQWESPRIAYIEKLHEYIIEQLGVERNLRETTVGITGTDYEPLGSKFQIREALELLLDYTQKAPNAYEHALMLTVGMSYIQPFADGNKRTARMTANAVLLANDVAPISYRSVDETAYKEALLIFYEQNSIAPFRELFVEQYIYSATHYNIAEPTQ